MADGSTCAFGRAGVQTDTRKSKKDNNLLSFLDELGDGFGHLQRHLPLGVLRKHASQTLAAGLPDVCKLVICSRYHRTHQVRPEVEVRVGGQEPTHAPDGSRREGSRTRRSGTPRSWRDRCLHRCLQGFQVPLNERGRMGDTESRHATILSVARCCGGRGAREEVNRRAVEVAIREKRTIRRSLARILVYWGGMGCVVACTSSLELRPSRGKMCKDSSVYLEQATHRIKHKLCGAHYRRYIILPWYLLRKLACGRRQILRAAYHSPTSPSHQQKPRRSDGTQSKLSFTETASLEHRQARIFGIWKVLQGLEKERAQRTDMALVR